jgi:2-polyprenyl-3-methyl-5-hydroxy-6-metoxy-1,4-benzoquinol methylase
MEAYSPDLWEGQERFSGRFYEHLLVPVWLSAMPEVQAKMERGAQVADVGCGHGKALMMTPESRMQSKDIPLSLFLPFYRTILDTGKIQR